MHLVGLTGFTLFSFAGLATSWLERELTSDARRKTVFSGLTVFFAATLLGNAVLLLAEYEFNIAQFDITFHPILLAGLTTFPLILIATLRPRTWSATMVTVVFTLIRLALLGWLTISNNLDLAGQSKPAIPLLILSGLVVDALISRRVAGWLAGLASGATTLAANDVMVGAYGIMPWTSSILMIGVPAGLILAAISGWMASRVAAQLEPSIKQPGVRA
jgi:hypothetical protein